MASEQFSLCWDNFHKNMSSGMNSLLENEDLVDVTLAVQGKCLKAHKMVLSVCSPYFKELFKSNPCKHPIVFMKDVSYEALSDLLQFMYQGEVQVSQENLTTFIKTAEALQIKGLTGDGNGSADTDVTETPIEKPHVEEYKPTSRPKKQSAPLVTTPSIKRPRLSTSESQVPPPIAKTEPAAQSQSDSAVQFKMEPYDQSTNLIDDTGDDNFGDDNLDDTANDDNEDYSMMESSMTGEEEPQAGTSADGAGEGQVLIYRTIPEGRHGEFIIIDKFVYKPNDKKKGSAKSEWCCTMRETSDCTANFALSDNIIETKDMRHNHDVIYQGDLEKCSIEIAEIRIESSAKKSKDEMYSRRNGKELRAAVQDSEPKKNPEKEKPSKKKHIEIRPKRTDSIRSKFSRRIVEDTSDSDSEKSINSGSPRDNKVKSKTKKQSVKKDRSDLRLLIDRKTKKKKSIS